MKETNERKMKQLGAQIILLSDESSIPNIMERTKKKMEFEK